MPSSLNTDLVDEYRLNWCFRYLREAKADYEYSKLVKSQKAYINLGLTAIRKAQTAVLYMLGEPTWVYTSIIAVMDGKIKVDEPLIRAMASMERFIRTLTDNAQSIPRDLFIRMVGDQISIAEKLVIKILETYSRRVFK